MKLDTVPIGIIQQHLMPLRKQKHFDDHVA